MNGESILPDVTVLVGSTESSFFFISLFFFSFLLTLGALVRRALVQCRFRGLNVVYFWMCYVVKRSFVCSGFVLMWLWWSEATLGRSCAATFGEVEAPGSGLFVIGMVLFNYVIFCFI